MDGVGLVDRVDRHLRTVAAPMGRSSVPARAARICTHYFRHDVFLEDGALLRGAPALAGIPARLVNGRFDLGGPLVNAWDLAHAWPGSELVVVGGAGHSTADPGMDAAIVRGNGSDGACALTYRAQTRTGARTRFSERAVRIEHDTVSTIAAMVIARHVTVLSAT